MVQLSHPYMTTGKTIAVTRWTLVVKVLSLLFNMLSRFVIAFLPRSKRLLISWLQSPSAVILEPKKIKPVTVSTVSPSICNQVMRLDAVIFVFLMLTFKPGFSPLFHFHQEALQFLFTFWPKGGVICISEVIDISPCNLIPACAGCPAFRMTYSACKLNKQGDTIQPWRTCFPIWNQSVGEWIYVYVWLSPSAVDLKPSQHC